MQLLKGIKNAYKQSEAAVVVRHLLITSRHRGMLSDDPGKIANIIVGNVWNEFPDLLNGEAGARPHKITVAALALANAINMECVDLPMSDSHIFAMCLGRITAELERRSEHYPLTTLDHKLLETSIQAFLEFGEAISETPLGQQTSKIIDQPEDIVPPSDNSSRETTTMSPAEKLSFFKSMHRIDDAYLDELLGKATPKGEIAAELSRMRGIVKSALAPMRAVAIATDRIGDPHRVDTVGYLFGWLDIFKFTTWGVRDFNRSFFHYGFLIWFSTPDEEDHESSLQSADRAMKCLGHNIVSPCPDWTDASQQGSDDALAYLRHTTLPRGPHQEPKN